MFGSAPKTLEREKRLRKRREYLSVQKHGVRSFGRFVVVIAKREQEGSFGKCGITVPKRVGPAHIRNKIKRRLRHILRLNQRLFYDRKLVVIARDSAKYASLLELKADLSDACRRLRSSKTTNFYAVRVA